MLSCASALSLSSSSQPPWTSIRSNCILHALAVALAGAEQRATLELLLSAPIARR